MGFGDIFKYKKVKEENAELKRRLDEIGYNEYAQVKQHIADSMQELQQTVHKENSEIQARKRDAERQLKDTNDEIASLNATVFALRETISGLEESSAKADKQLKSVVSKIAKGKELYKSIEYSAELFHAKDAGSDFGKLGESEVAVMEEMVPSVILKLHCMDVRDLKRAFRDNDKQIEKILSLYSTRYTTKANQAIYKLMVIALKAELQNILYNLKYEKLDNAISNVKNTTAKYLAIAGDGNQSIAGTLTKFIGEIEYLFMNAVKIEYNYYVKKEQAKQEQLAIREQMRQEAEERKALEAEKKKIEAEELKYQNEIDKLLLQMNVADESEQKVLDSRILELRGQLADVAVQKEKILTLANGRAGSVYVISNLGSFGDKVFKIGMTRRIDPQLRVDELGDASVPFRYDVHSFIFSDDAVGLESKLHELLRKSRVNKVNLRKEFFNTSIEELAQLVEEVDPTAEFNRTMAAEEYYQSVSSDEMYSSDYIVENIDEE